jgi:hypothetical protein
MKNIGASIIIFTVIIGVSQFFISDAHAYLDPGSGSIVIQAIVGALVGVGITIKIYWYKLKEKLIRNQHKK